MEITTKKQISAALNQHLQLIYERDGSTQTDFYKQHNLNDGYVSSVKNGKVEGKYPADSFYVELATIIGFSLQKTYWKHIDTTLYKSIIKTAETARVQKKLIGVDGNTGAGKSHSVERIASERPGTTALIVADATLYVTKATHNFIQQIYNACGYKEEMKISNMRKKIFDKARNTPNFLFIFDETEYLNKQCWDIIKGIYRELDSQCGFLVCGLGIQKYVENRAASKWGGRGWQQIASRMKPNWNILPDMGAGVQGWNTECERVLKQVSKFFTKSAISWFATNCQDYRDIMHYASEILLVADEEKWNKIEANILDGYFFNQSNSNPYSE
ncbi:ATP-binding protein [Bernardetia sp. Wsw4-3y2]|uniref:ATP-binding protein n=1 Tax=Bernardetia sp. Wsw4-3y2 TaxID=3127471 RepID=UPI0030D5BE6F